MIHARKRILVDINHPAHVHLFKHFINEIKYVGFDVLVTAKNVSSITDLLDLYNISYIKTGVKKDRLFLKYIYEFVHLVRVLSIVINRRVDYGIGVSVVLPIVSRLTSMKSIVLDDDDLAVTPISGKFISYADIILNPDALAYEKRGEQQVCYPGFHELAYLHPNRFVPDSGIFDELNLAVDEPFFILRFNAFKAHHDTGACGLSITQKLKVVELLTNFGRVFITAERSIDPELSRYKLMVSPDKIHSLLYYATLFVGDSQTMTTEAALLGTPSVKLNSFAGKLSIPNELENKYKLCYSFLPDDFQLMMDKLRDLLTYPDVKKVWRDKRDLLLKDKIDVTSYLVRIVSEYSKGSTSTIDCFSANNG